MRLKRESLFAPASVPCFDFKGGEGEEPARRTVIIAPIRVIEEADGNLQISWACSRGAFCRDKNCRYSHAALNKQEENPTTPI